MYTLCSLVEFAGARLWRTDRITSAEITRSADSLTAVCRITLPRRVRWDGIYECPLRRGDGVWLSLGYNGDPRRVFTGYVRSVTLRQPVEIECEDETSVLKTTPALKKAYRAASLEDLLTEQLPGIYTRVTGYHSLGPYRVRADTQAGLLSDLKEEYGIRSFFRHEETGPVLCSGAVWEGSAEPGVVFDDSVNLVDASRLKSRTEEDSGKTRVRAVSLMPDGRTETAEAGDPGGELRTLHTTGIEGDDLRKWAEDEMARIAADAGLTGSLTAFGGRVADLYDTVGIVIGGKRRGVYLTEKNTIRFGADGFRQEITIGRRTGE